MPSCLAALTIASSVATARAQAAPPAPPAARGPDVAAEADDASAEADEEEAAAKPAPKKKPTSSAVGASEKKKSDGASDEVPPEPPKTAAMLPPPVDPRADEQEPRPFPSSSPPLSRVRHVEIGPDAGLWVRSAEGSSVSYAPAFAWGFHARSELFEYLAAAVFLSRARHDVDVRRGGLGLVDTEVDQPALDVLELGARAEPTYRPVPDLRLWLGLGVAWGLITAKEPSTSGANAVASADRRGVFLEYSASLGATWDVIPSWLALSLSGSAGLLSNQRGDVFYDHQAISQSGSTTTIGGLPKLESSYSVLFGVGMIL